MKRLTETNFFRTLREISQENISPDTQLLQSEYEEFALLLFSERAASTDKATLHDSLEYTLAEFSDSAKISKKKLRGISVKRQFV